MHRARLPSALLLLAAATFAQTTNVLPAAAATADPGSHNSTLLYGSTSINVSRTQVLYDAADVKNSGVFKSLAVRAYAGGSYYAATMSLRIDMSASPVGYLAASSTYANNHGPNVVTVFNGQISMPSRPPTPWPTPWETPFLFTTPFTFSAASATSLCVEFYCTLNSAQQSCYVEAAYPNDGLGTHAANVLNTGCIHSGNSVNNSVGYIAPVIGRSFGPVTWHSLPESNPSWHVNALLIGDTGAGGPFGPFTLPVLLTALGLPAANASCMLANDVDLTLPLTYTGSLTPNHGTFKMAALPVPNDAALAGRDFFTQPVAFDVHPVTQVPAVWAGYGSRWTIGDTIRRGLPLTEIWRTGANAVPEGFVRTYTGPTIRIGL